MMELRDMIVAIIILLSCLFGAIFLFYKAIRYFMEKKVWRGIGALLFSLVLGFIVIILFFGGGTSREMKNKAHCESNLKFVVQFLKMYAADHQESYPSTFNGLAGTNLVNAGDASIFVGLSSHHKVGSLENIHSWTDYAYVSGLSESDPAGCVVAFCIPDNHRGKGANVAFKGGHVLWFSCTPYKDSTGKFQPTFQELTNNPTLFYGTTNEAELADLTKRTRIIYPQKVK